MSPEQQRGERLDSRTDIYSFGIVIYEMVTGCIRKGKEELKGIPFKFTPIKWVIRKATKGDPDKRYQSADKLQKAFLQVLRIVQVAPLAVCLPVFLLVLMMLFNIIPLPPPNHNRPPAFVDDITDKQIDEGKPLEFEVKADDPDGDELKYWVTDNPTGATFDPEERKFSWTPGFDQAGNYTVTFHVKDNKDGEVSKPVAIEVIGYAVINIDASPEVERVFFDEEDLGPTPIRRGVERGTHYIKFERSLYRWRGSGYVNGERMSSFGRNSRGYYISITMDTQVTLTSADWTENYALVRVTSDPRAEQILINGRPIEQESDIRVERGRCYIMAIRAEYEWRGSGYVNGQRINPFPRDGERYYIFIENERVTIVFTSADWEERN